MGCGINSEQICKEFLIMNDDNPIYKNLEFVYDDVDIDYFVIISFANDDEYFIPEKTIIFQMEPYVYDLSKNWGTHSWDTKWANPDETKFLHIRRHPKYLNVAQWQFHIPKTINSVRRDKFIAIISAKIQDTGHRNRIDFIKYVEERGHDIIDVYGYQNYHNFKNYKGSITDKGIQSDYKYVFSVENNQEYGYITEKLWESFISCSLCFYQGAPDADNYIYPESFVAIDSTNKEETLSLMLDAIENNLWSKRFCHILNARNMTIEKYGFFPIVYDIINEKQN